jgi:hypothetical protein
LLVDEVALLLTSEVIEKVIERVIEKVIEKVIEAVLTDTNYHF